MRTADHMNLSRYIMKNMADGAPWILKMAFIFGSIEPDINVLTYFRGSIHGEEKLRGHNYENAVKYMEKLAERLDSGKLGKLSRSFILGKLIHYVADAFTYPHNAMFKGSLRQHCQYETELHEYVNNMITEDQVKMRKLPENTDAIEYVEAMHRCYEALERTDHTGHSDVELQADFYYITGAISMVTDRFWNVETETEGRLDTIRHNMPALNKGSALSSPITCANVACAGADTMAVQTGLTVVVGEEMTPAHASQGHTRVA